RFVLRCQRIFHRLSRNTRTKAIVQAHLGQRDLSRLVRGTQSDAPSRRILTTLPVSAHPPPLHRPRSPSLAPATADSTPGNPPHTPEIPPLTHPPQSHWPLRNTDTIRS